MKEALAASKAQALKANQLIDRRQAALGLSRQQAVEQKNADSGLLTLGSATKKKLKKKKKKKTVLGDATPQPEDEAAVLSSAKTASKGPPRPPPPPPPVAADGAVPS